jgi:hypothetical protein
MREGRQGVRRLGRWNLKRRNTLRLLYYGSLSLRGHFFFYPPEGEQIGRVRHATPPVEKKCTQFARVR